MTSPLFILDYLSWHYTRAFRDIGSVWLNFMWFILHFFSMPLFLRTLFLTVEARECWTQER